MRCSSCNWATHDPRRHGGQLCPKGHPLTIVGRTRNGSCKRCRADRARRYYYSHQQRENARSRAYHWAHRAAILARKRHGGRAVPSEDHPWRRM